MTAATRRRSHPGAWLDQMLALPGFEPSNEHSDAHSGDARDHEANAFDRADDSAAADIDEGSIRSGVDSSRDDHVRSTDPTALTTQVTRSKRRSRTVGWQVRGDVLHITIPSWMSAADESRWVSDIEQRTARKVASQRIDLRSRAASLAARYSLPVPTEIKWSDDMNHRWGSCTPATQVVRISSRLVPYPAWVLDYVIVHELAHISVPDHSPAFWTIVHRYPKAERATGYLIAKSGDDDSVDD